MSTSPSSSHTNGCAGVSVTTIAGGDSREHIDGTLTDARFRTLQGIHMGPSNQIYVSDAQLVRMCWNEFVTTEAGQGRSRLKDPWGLCVDPRPDPEWRYLYICDAGAHCIRRAGFHSWANSFKMDVFAGVENKNGYQDGIASSSLFFKPKAITCDSKGVLYIADSGNNRIRRIEDGVVKTIAGTGVQGAPFVDGPAKTATFNNPHGIALDHSGNLFICDRDFHRIRRLSDGVVTTYAGSGNIGSNDGMTPYTAEFNWPSGLCVDGVGNVYVADTNNNLIRLITPDGQVSTIGTLKAPRDTRSGQPIHLDGVSNLSTFNGPVGVAADAEGHVYVVEINNPRIRKLTIPHHIRTRTPAPKPPSVVTVDTSSSSSSNGNGRPRTDSMDVKSAAPLSSGGKGGFTRDCPECSCRRYRRGVMSALCDYCHHSHKVSSFDNTSPTSASASVANTPSFSPATAVTSPPPSLIDLDIFNMSGPPVASAAIPMPSSSGTAASAPRHHGGHGHHSHSAAPPSSVSSMMGDPFANFEDAFGSPLGTSLPFPPDNTSPPQGGNGTINHQLGQAAAISRASSTSSPTLLAGMADHSPQLTPAGSFVAPHHPSQAMAAPYRINNHHPGHHHHHYNNASPNPSPPPSVGFGPMATPSSVASSPSPFDAFVFTASANMSAPGSMISPPGSMLMTSTTVGVPDMTRAMSGLSLTPGVGHVSLGASAPSSHVAMIHNHPVSPPTSHRGTNNGLHIASPPSHGGGGTSPFDAYVPSPSSSAGPSPSNANVFGIHTNGHGTPSNAIGMPPRHGHGHSNSHGHQQVFSYAQQPAYPSHVFSPTHSSPTSASQPFNAFAAPSSISASTSIASPSPILYAQSPRHGLPRQPSSTSSPSAASTTAVVAPPSVADDDDFNPRAAAAAASRSRAPSVATNNTSSSWHPFS